MIIVGSFALRQWVPDYREPKDLDIWLYEKEDTICGIADSYTVSKELYDLIPTKDGYATLDALYTIKLSHLGWDVHWEKTKKDVLFFKSLGCDILPELYLALVEQWKKDYGNKDFLSLNKDKEDFFTDNVTYKYDHDYLHELVAYPNKPKYLSCLKESEEVLIDKDEFDWLPFEDKVRMFREEITVIACERWVLNDYFKGRVSWYEAYKLSLKKTITRLTKGWATEFITKNIEYFVKPEYSYFEYILNKLGANNMTVDTTIFEEFKEKLSDGESLEDFIGMLAEGDLCISHDVPYPVKGGRAYKDESYQKELSVYRDEVKAYEDFILAPFGYEHLDQDGGGEGGSEYCYGVFKFMGKIYKAEYSYYSHEGNDCSNILDSLREVTLVEKTITVYE